MERFKGFTRDKAGDREPVKLPCNDVVIPRRIGYKTPEGTLVQVGEEMSQEIEMGWGEAIGEVLGEKWEPQVKKLKKKGVIFEA